MRLIMVYALLTSPALAMAPSFDCGLAEGAVETLICEDAELGALDQRLAERFAAALTAAQSLDAGAAEAEATLRATQRGWIAGRNECWKVEDGRGCVEDAYLMREGQLVARWMLEPPSATVGWACNGNPADEVVTMFFDTALPSVRLERGDSLDAGTLVRTASGARYEGSFGRSIWVHGDDATYREPDPVGTELSCTRAWGG